MQVYLQKSFSYVRFLGILLLGHVSVVSALRNSMFAKRTRAAHLLLRMFTGHSRCALIASRSSVGHVVGFSTEHENKKEIIQRVAKEVFAEYGVEVEFCSSPFSRSAMLKQVWHCPRLIERVEIGTMIQFNSLRLLPVLAAASSASKFRCTPFVCARTCTRLPRAHRPPRRRPSRR